MATNELFITYTDASHGDCVDTGRSTAEYVTMIAGGAIVRYISLCVTLTVVHLLLNWLLPAHQNRRASWEHLGRSFYRFLTHLNNSYFGNSHQTHSQSPSTPSTQIDSKLSDTFTLTTFYGRAQLWSHWTTWSGTVEHPNLLSINKFTPSTCFPCSQITYTCHITLYTHSVDVSKPLRLSAATLPVISLLCGLVLSWAITWLFLGLLWQINCQPLSSTSFATTFRPPHRVVITHTLAKFRCDPIIFDLTYYPHYSNIPHNNFDSHRITYASIML